MPINRIALSAAFATALAALPLSTAKAQYYDPCVASPLAFPFCVAGAVVGTAATIATAPFWLLAGAPPPYPYGYGYVPPYYPAPSPAYYAAPYPAYAPPAAGSPQATPEAPVPLTPPPAPGTHPPASYAPPSVRDVYYFCPASQSYYPYVAQCAVGWRPVPAAPPHS